MVRWGVCDTVVVVPDEGPVWLAKNSHREPSEAQSVECHDGSVAGAAPAGLPEARGNTRLVLSRPAWMWGCETGVNQHGLAIGNEAVFTRLPAPNAGYTGMDFQRVTLTTCRTADGRARAANRAHRALHTRPAGWSTEVVWFATTTRT